MSAANRNEVVRLLPDIQDHAVIEILAMGATVGEIEAALAELTGGDESLIEIERREGDRINRLLAILRQSQIEAPDDREP